MRLITTDKAKPGMVLQADVFASQESVIPVLKQGSVLSPKIIRALRTHGIYELLVDGSEAPMPNGFVVSKPPIDPELQKLAIENLQNLFGAINTGDESTAISAPKLVRELDVVISQLVDSLSEDDRALVNIADLKSYDEYTYHHSLSVAVLSIAIGQSLGFGVKKLHALGKCAIMHDIGKTAIPIEIINKPARLSDSESNIIRQHPTEGYQYLVQHKIAGEEIWHSVLHHHERKDGTGYPSRLRGNQIPLMSRIISVADVYDALTSMRPYRKPMQPNEAIEYVMGNIDTMFDYDIVMAFMKKLELYPVGSYVQLSNGRVARVLSTENLMRPVVQLVTTGEIIDLYSDFRYLRLTITRLLTERGAPTIAQAQG